ncbi:MAG: hypothetical protein V3V16_11130 [Melioribacteraceae bacterium]
MNFINNFNISFTSSPYFLVFGLVLILLFSIYNYRTTLPVISIFSKVILIILRFLGLSLILFLLFDPTINYSTKETLEPKNLLIIDNSKSISQFSTSEEILKIKSIAKSINENTNGKSEIFELGKLVKKITSSKIDSISFSETGTNLSSIIDLATKENQLSSIVLFSDGIITEGESPISQAKNLGVPIYVIGVGDTSNTNDVKISAIRSNEFIYINAKTEIEVTVKHNGLTNEKAILQLIENNKIIEQKPIVLSPSGTNRVMFNYSNKKSGEHKLSTVIKYDKSEKNKVNNSKSKIINIVDTKKKIFVISGSPNADLSAITSSLKSNKDFEIESVVQLGKNKFYKNKSSISSLSNADVLFIINFPTAGTTIEVIDEIQRIITSTSKPIFYCLSSNVDYVNLNSLKSILPFEVSNNRNTYEPSQVKIFSSTNNLLGNNEQTKNQWTKLSPINITNSKISANVSSEILLSSTNNNDSPIIFTNNVAGQKSIILNAFNFWRWKLKAPNKEYKLFDNFIFNSVKWLSINNDDDRFNITLTKKSFNLGETIVFSASVYDETLVPVNTASIQLEINNSISSFNSIGNGFYECEVNIGKPGSYQYKAKILDNNKNTNIAKGKFNIETTEIEFVESRMNKELLISLTNVSDGKYFSVNNSKELVDILNSNYERNIKFKFIDNKLKLSSLEAILFSIIFFFGLEWLIRKILKML